MPAIPPSPRDAYRHFRAIQTRWKDNDAFGHVNNATYQAWMDTAIMLYLLEVAGYDAAREPVINVVLETSCRFMRPLAFPQPVELGLAVSRLGRTSVHYEVGFFAAGAPLAAATGRVADVFVERATMRPAPIPAAVRAALARLARDGAAPA